MAGARTPLRTVKAKQSLVRRLAREPGFVGAGVAADPAGQPEIVVLVAARCSPVLAKVPDRWQGIPVRVQVTGAVRKFSPGG